MDTQQLPLPPPGRVPFIPDSSPFSAAQRQFLNGLLAGLFSTAAASAIPAAPPLIPLTILIGTESGNSTILGRKLKQMATAAGMQPEVVDLGCFDPARIRQLRNVAVITSTHGDGHPPENAQAFYDYLFSEDAPTLGGLNFSVLALGDKNYAKFCQCGKDFDQRLEQLGAKRYQERLDCDVDYEPVFQQWSQGVIASVKAAGSSVDAKLATAPAGVELSVVEEPQKAPLPSYNRRNPFEARLLKSLNLNGDGSAKETRHCEITLGDSGLSYEPGDALGVYPTNCPSLVQSILDALNLDGEEGVESSDNGSVPLRYALTHLYEIRNLKASFIRKLSEMGSSADLKALLDADRSEELQQFISEREILDLLIQYPGILRDPQALLSCLEPLQPRLYSIASSPRAVGREVHLTVGVVRYNSLGRERKGVCSSFLAERAVESPLRVFVQPNRHFRLPGKDTPVIMIGPGTGIAPFRSFLQEREAVGSRGRAWLFFGDRSGQTDFLYRSELEGYQEKGVLTRLDTAWSRDQGQKVYVQHRMRENAAELYRWLQDGASIYVCGDAKRMAPDVDAALRDVVSSQGGVSADAASEYIEQLRKDKRYLRDVY